MFIMQALMLKNHNKSVYFLKGLLYFPLAVASKEFCPGVDLTDASCTI